MQGRLRKPFKYAGEDESDSVMDEQEQEEVIEALAAQDASMTRTYRKLFVAIPLVAAVYYEIATLLALLFFTSWENLAQHGMGFVSLYLTTTVASSIALSQPNDPFDQLERFLSWWKAPQSTNPQVVAWAAFVTALAGNVVVAREVFSDSHAWMSTLPPIRKFRVQPSSCRPEVELNYEYCDNR